MPPWSSWWRWTTPRSNIPRCRTGIPATRTAWAASTISSPSAAIAAATVPRFPGRRWKPARPSPGNIPAASCAATTRVGEFYSIAIANNYQQADTGTKMIHLGKNTRSRIISKGISAGKAQNTYRGLVSVHAQGRERAQLHAMRLAADRRANAAPIPCPISKAAIPAPRIEHEATTSKIAEDQLFYCLQRGIGAGRSGGADRQRLLQGSAAATADGIRGRGAEAGGHFSGRQRGLVMLEIKNLHVSVGGKEILKGLNLSHRRRPGACHHGPERLGQVHAVLCAGGPRRL